MSALRNNPSHITAACEDRDIFWEVFRDTGDPICWLLTRGERLSPKDNEPRERREKKPAAPG